MTGTQFEGRKTLHPRVPRVHDKYTTMVSAAGCLPSSCEYVLLLVAPCDRSSAASPTPPPCARLDDLPSNPSPNLSTPLACSEWLRSYLSPLHHYCGVGCLSRVGSSTNSSYIDCYNIRTHYDMQTCTPYVFSHTT